MKEVIILASGIYKFENNINHMIYIGQAINLKERYKKHIKNINDLSHQEDFYIGLREFGLNNFSYEILEKFNDFDQEKLNKLEDFYIKKFNCLKPNGYNMIPGGSNGAGISKGKPVEQYDLLGNFIAKYKSAHEASRQTNINYSSICSCCREEIDHVKEYQWKYSNSNKKITPITLTNITIQNLPVYQFSMDNILIKKYNSLQEASTITKINKSLICRCCNNKGITAGGFKWSYNQQINNNKNIKNQKPVGQYDKQNNLIAKYNSLSEASKKTNINLANISQVCQGKRKTAGKYIWKFL